MSNQSKIMKLGAQGVVLVILASTILLVAIEPARAAEPGGGQVIPKWIYHQVGGQAMITDAVNVIWYSRGQAWWIQSLLVFLANWDYISFVGSDAYLDEALSDKQDRQLEWPANWIIERYHVRIWDMGESPNWGWWAVGGVHLETVDLATLTHKIVPDGWERAEQKLLDDWKAILPARNANRTWIDNYTIDLQGSSNDGQAIFLEVPPFPTPFSGSGGGSPYVATWDGSAFADDNNLLAFEEGMLGVEQAGVEGFDHYRIQKSIIQDGGKYRLLLREFETEHTFFDRARLMAVDHPNDVGIALTASGRITTYKAPKPPVVAADNTGADQTSALSTSDGVFYQGNTSSWVVMDFGPLDTTNGARLLLKSDPPPACCYKLSILIQIRNPAGAWRNITLVVPRQFWSTDAIDLSTWLPDPFGEFKVRLFFTMPHKLDLAAIDTSSQVPVTRTEADLLNAFHSTRGNVKAALGASDNVYADILPGEEIELSFGITTKVQGVRDFVLIVEGKVVPPL